MIVKHGWNEQIAFSFFAKEATYGAGVTINDTNAASLDGFEAEVSWPDRVETDKGEVTGKEHGNDQELIEQSVTINVKEPHAKPLTVAGFGSLVMGRDAAPNQDAALQAWKQKLRPVAVTTALDSVRCLHKKGDVEYQYDGLKGNKIALSGEAGGVVSAEYEVMGNGSRTRVATAFPSVVQESWMRLATTKCWLAGGALISIDPVPVQGVESISSGSPVDLGVRLKSFNWSWLNNLNVQRGFGGQGLALDIDKGRRSVELSVELLFESFVELDYFINQNPIAIEFDCFGAIIVGGGAYRFGFDLIIPRFKLKNAPVAQGGPDDDISCTLECEVFDDGTNPASMLDVYTSKQTFLA